MERLNGKLYYWNIGMECWNGRLKWNVEMEWNVAMKYNFGIKCLNTMLE